MTLQKTSTLRALYTGLRQALEQPPPWLAVDLALGAPVVWVQAQGLGAALGVDPGWAILALDREGIPAQGSRPLRVHPVTGERLSRRVRWTAIAAGPLLEWLAA